MGYPFMWPVLLFIGKDLEAKWVTIANGIQNA